MEYDPYGNPVRVAPRPTSPSFMMQQPQRAQSPSMPRSRLSFPEVRLQKLPTMGDFGRGLHATFGDNTPANVPALHQLGPDGQIQFRKVMNQNPRVQPQPTINQFQSGRVSPFQTLEARQPLIPELGGPTPDIAGTMRDLFAPREMLPPVGLDFSNISDPKLVPFSELPIMGRLANLIPQPGAGIDLDPFNLGGQQQQQAFQQPQQQPQPRIVMRQQQQPQQQMVVQQQPQQQQQRRLVMQQQQQPQQKVIFQQQQQPQQLPQVAFQQQPQQLPQVTFQQQPQQQPQQPQQPQQQQQPQRRVVIRQQTQPRPTSPVQFVVSQQQQQQYQEPQQQQYQEPQQQYQQPQQQYPETQQFF